MERKSSSSSRERDRSERAILDLLGLAARAGALTTGTDRVRSAIREEKVRGVILAADTSSTQQAKLKPLLAATGLPYHVLFTRQQLGAALGRPPVSAVGISDLNFARRVAQLAATLSSLQDQRGESK